MGNDASNRRGWWVGAAGVLAVLVLVALWWPRAPEPTESREQPVTQAPAPADAPVRAPPRSPMMSTATQAEPSRPSEEPPPGTTPEQPDDAPPEELPPTTQVLAEEFQPGTTEWEDVPVDETQQHRLRILPLRYNVVAPRPIAVLLEITDRQGKRQPLSNPHVRVRPLEDATKPWLEVPVKDDGSGEDEQSGDLRYTATLQPTREQQKQLLGRVMIEGSVDVPGVGTRVIPAILLYTQGPRARLTGRWHDSVRDGNLLLEAELEVEQPGVFTLMAQVFGPNQEPIAWVKQTQKLGKGRGTPPLEVFGKVLHDAAIDGPYRVRQVLLTRDQENSSDYDPGETVEEAYRTRPYRASEFSPKAYVPPPRIVDEVTAEHPSQKDKPPPLRERDMEPASNGSQPPAQQQPAPGDAPPQQAADLAH